MHILIAPNAFKHSLTAEQAAIAIERGLRGSRLICTTECFPVGDGGDGTAALLIKKMEATIVPLRVMDALGRSIEASYGLTPNGETAIIEMADAAGTRLLKSNELNSLRASSFGTGELIQHAVQSGAKKIIIGMGGSATVDGGTGMLQALGIRFLNAQEIEVPGLPENLCDIVRIDSTGLSSVIATVEIIVLCDVGNPLLGPAGAAAVFGPQKGASAADIVLLERGLAHFSKLITQTTGKNIDQLISGGTAGGAAAGLHALLNAQLVNGIEYFLQLTDFDAALSRSDLVITGEGSIDEQTLEGKAPYGVAVKARARQLPVIGLAGKVPRQPATELLYYFPILMAIGSQPEPINEALKATARNLERTGSIIGDLLAINSHR